MADDLSKHRIRETYSRLLQINNSSTGAVLKGDGSDCGPLQIDSYTAVAVGAGFSVKASQPQMWVQSINGEVVTTIYHDIGAGSIVSSSDAGDVIGLNNASSSYLTRIQTATNGIIYKGEIICLEVPTTGDPDINLSANSIGSLAEDAGGEAQHVLANCGVHTLAGRTELTIPSGGIQSDYLYFTHGGTTAGTYDAGKLLIKLYGYVV